MPETVQNRVHPEFPLNLSTLQEFAKTNVRIRTAWDVAQNGVIRNITQDEKLQLFLYDSWLYLTEIGSTNRRINKLMDMDEDKRRHMIATVLSINKTQPPIKGETFFEDYQEMVRITGDVRKRKMWQKQSDVLTELDLWVLFHTDENYGSGPIPYRRELIRMKGMPGKTENEDEFTTTLRIRNSRVKLIKAGLTMEAKKMRKAQRVDAMRTLIKNKTHRPSPEEIDKMAEHFHVSHNEMLIALYEAMGENPLPKWQLWLARQAKEAISEDFGGLHAWENNEISIEMLAEKIRERTGLSEDMVTSQIVIEALRRHRNDVGIPKKKVRYLG